MWKSLKELLHLSSHGFHVFAVSEEYCVKAEDPQVLCFSYELCWISGREIAVPSFPFLTRVSRTHIARAGWLPIQNPRCTRGRERGRDRACWKVFQSFSVRKNSFPQPSVKKCCRLSRQAKLIHCNNCTMLSIRAPFLYNQSPGHPEIH